MLYEVTVNYTGSLAVAVEAEDEAEALTKARDEADEMIGLTNGLLWDRAKVAEFVCNLEGDRDADTARCLTVG